MEIAVGFFQLEMVNHFFEAGLSCLPIWAVCLLMSCCDLYLISTTLAQCHVHLVGIEEFPACVCYSSSGFSEKWKPPLKFCWRDQSWNFQWQQRGLNSFCAVVSPELGNTSQGPGSLCTKSLGSEEKGMRAQQHPVLSLADVEVL